MELVSVDLRGSARTLGLGVLEEVLFLVSLFNLSREYQYTVRKRFERSHLLRHGVGLEDINEGWRLESR